MDLMYRFDITYRGLTSTSYENMIFIMLIMAVMISIIFMIISKYFSIINPF